MAGYIGSGASVVSSGAENKKVFDITTNTTSLTGLNYTVGKVHVYHNGVRLVDGTDYTATNSTSITLTVAAVSGDQVVVVSYASFQLSEHYTKAETDTLIAGADSTPSITDNGNATAITITSDENVGIGVTPSAAYKMQVNVATNTVSTGSPAASSLANIAGGTATVGDGVSLQLTNVSGAKETAWRVSAVTASGNNGDLVFNGYAGGADYPERMRILSGGGITFNGDTAAANALDNYEEGDWTPTPNSGSYSAAGGKYTKVGRVVTLNFDITVGSSGAGAFMTLPFSSTTTTSNAIYTSPQNFAAGRTAFYGVAAGTTLYFRVTGDNIAYSAQTLDANVVLHGSITYQTT
ncbi:hypothetical protein N9I36_00495 [Planktomarina temperata]|nr:hypothetical protein [Planktomarina temperata]